MKKRVIDYQLSEQDRFSLFEMSCFLEEKIYEQSELYIKSEDANKKVEIYDDLLFFLRVYKAMRQIRQSFFIQRFIEQIYQQLQLLNNDKPKIKDNIELILRTCEEITNGSKITESREIINTYNPSDGWFIFGLSWVAGIITAIATLAVKLNYQ